jgi:octaprenyl-diphosphate synthase
VGAHGGGSREQVQGLAAYGHHLGMAFQIVDDRLDLAGDEATVGKSLGVDLREGKLTLPVILWLRGRPARERDESRALVEAAGRDEAAQARLVGRLLADGALGAADAAARDESPPRRPRWPPCPRPRPRASCARSPALFAARCSRAQ